jgi:hypothetical protein
MNKNFWGEPEPDDLPDWMKPETYKNPQPKKKGSDMNDVIMEALKKPPIPVEIKEPKL